MVELFKLAMDKPLHALTFVTCCGVLALTVRIISIESAVAVIQSEQLTDHETRDKVSVMSDTVSRMDSKLNTIMSHWDIPRSTPNESSQ